jgi:Na+-driven multidrug efflux pump
MTDAPRFATGNVMRHVVVMAGTGAIGLIAVFAVDLLNFFYISLLGQKAIAAAVGFAGVVGFFQTSIMIGLTIGVNAVVARRIGASAVRDAHHIAGSGLVLMTGVGLIVGLGTVLLLGPILHVLGASGETRSLAASFLTISSPSLPLLAAGMCCSGLLRCVGDARRAMNVTLLAAAVTATLDPALIFGLHLGLPGAAFITVLSRCVLARLGWVGAARRHDLIARPPMGTLGHDLAEIGRIAGPALLTNLATPVGAAYVTRAMAMFGPDAVAGQATIDRISPVAFGLVYALSGAVGPIIAQNAGAGWTDRVCETLRDSFVFVMATVLFAWGLLAVAQPLIVHAFFARRDCRTRPRLLFIVCSRLPFHRRAVRGERGVQQSRLSDIFHPVQLGPCHARHDPVRDHRRAFRAGGRAGGAGLRVRGVRGAGRRYGVLHRRPSGQRTRRQRECCRDTCGHRQRCSCRPHLTLAACPA